MDEDFLNFGQDFQKDFFQKILKHINRCESVLLIAPPGMGKSTLAKLLSKRIAAPLISLEDVSVEPEKRLWDLADKNTIIIDHAERLLDERNETFILALKSFRERGREKISFVFLSNRLLKHDILFPIEPFLLENIFYLPPLNNKDAKIFLHQIEKNFGVTLSANQAEEIIKNSGGVPRLIKRLVKLAADKTDPATDPRLKLDLERIAGFLKNNPDAKYQIPLSDFQNESLDQIGDVKFAQTLTKQEHLLAKLLIGKAGELVSREEMIKTVWPKNLLETSEHALDQMIHRTRKKLESATPKCRLTVYRGRGVKLNWTS